MLARRSLAVLKEGIEEGLFSGAAYALVSKRIPGGTGTLGRLAFDPETDRVNRDTLFDVASLTKPLATAMAALQLVEKGGLALEADAADLLDGRASLHGISLFHLLTHTSGLPAVPSDSGAPSPLEAALGSVPATTPGKDYLYSDTGYLLLGEIVRRAGKRQLDRWYAEEIAQPLHLPQSGFLPDIIKPIAATMDDEAFDGLPHDPRAREIGGVAGHAGLFASIGDLAAYSRALLGSGRALLTSDLFERLFRNEIGGVGYQSLGFFCQGNAYIPDTPGFSPESVGHSGFTGCFLLIDRPNQAAVCLLTNRVLNVNEDAARFLELRRNWLSAAAQDLGLA